MIELREATKKDIYHFYFIYIQNITYTKTKKMPTFEEHREWWKIISNKENLYMILNNFGIIGYIRITKKTKEISIALNLYWQNKGIGSKALKLLKEKPLLARVHKSNKRSLHFFNKNNIPIEMIE